MMVNPDVDGYNKTLNHRKILRSNLQKAKRMLNPKPVLFKENVK